MQITNGHHTWSQFQCDKSHKPAYIPPAASHLVWVLSLGVEGGDSGFHSRNPPSI